MKEKIYIIGHKNPDTDSICSAIAYAEYLKKKGKNARACKLGKINPETRFVLDYFRINSPKNMPNIKGKKVILLDHNEKEQSADQIEKAVIVEIIDHHKISFSYPSPIFFYTEPIGSTASIIAKKYLNDKKTKLPKKIAGILLAAILSDTVIFRSPITTPEDKKIAKKLAKIAQIKDLESFGVEMKNKKANLKGLTPKDILYSDFKDFNFSQNKVGIGQVELCDLKEAEKMKAKFLEKLEEIARKENYTLLILMLTNIIKKDSLLLFAGNKDYLEKAFKKPVENHSLYLKDVLSRKREIVPPLTEIFEPR